MAMRKYTFIRKLRVFAAEIFKPSLLVLLFALLPATFTAKRTDNNVIGPFRKPRGVG